MLLQSRFRPATLFRIGMLFLIVGILSTSLPRLGYAIPDAALGALVGFSYGMAIACVVVAQRMKRDGSTRGAAR
jgi:hypothetical protein